MNGELKSIEEKLALLEKEIATVADGLEGQEALGRELEDLKFELRAVKVFLERHHQELGRELPGIIRKLKTG